MRGFLPAVVVLLGAAALSLWTPMKANGAQVVDVKHVYDVDYGQVQCIGFFCTKQNGEVVGVRHCDWGLWYHCSEQWIDCVGWCRQWYD